MPASFQHMPMAFHYFQLHMNLSRLCRHPRGNHNESIFHPNFIKGWLLSTSCEAKSEIVEGTCQLHSSTCQWHSITFKLHLNLSRTMQTAKRPPFCIYISSKVYYNLLHARLSQKLWKVHASYIPAHGNGIPSLSVAPEHSRLYRHPRATLMHLYSIKISSKVD
jgi:hypothetical protein